jgi:hypothetical protein
MDDMTATVSRPIGVVCNDCGQRLPIIQRTGDRTRILIVEHPVCPHTLRRDVPDGDYERWLAEVTKQVKVHG